MANDTSKEAVQAGAGALTDPERRMLSHPSIDEAVVIARKDAAGAIRRVAYVVAREGATAEGLMADLRRGLPPQDCPDDLLCVTALPVAADGCMATDRLMQIQVPDDGLTRRWESAASGVDGVDAVAVLSVPARVAGSFIHRSILRPRRAAAEVHRPAPSPVEDAGARSATTGPLAIVHGESLPLPADCPPTLAAALRRAASQHPDHGVLCIDASGAGRFVRYPQLLERARQIHGGLHAAGLRAGDKVILQLRDNADLIPAFWGCVLGAMVPVPASIPAACTAGNATVQKLVHAWRLLGCAPVLASPDLAGPLKSACADLGATEARILTLGDLAGAPPVPESDPDPGAIALILLTSGSTGAPKAVTHSHRTLLAWASAMTCFNGLGAADRSLNWMPLDHVGGIVFFHLRDVLAGALQLHVATEYILSDPLRWLDFIDAHHVTNTWAPNFAYALVADRSEEIAARRWDLGSMRLFMNGGEAVVPRTARRFMSALVPHRLPATAMCPVWGMTEISSAVTYSRVFPAEPVPDESLGVDLGPPIPNTSLRIVDAGNRILREGEKGRLQVRGATVTPGYLNNPVANESAFTPDGWFDTGDIAFLRNGCLHVTARAKDDIIINGVHFPAAEIEAVTESVPGVRLTYSAACAVRSSSSETDELAIFFSPVADDEPSLRRVLQEIRRRVAAEANVNPSHLVPVAPDEIPKTVIGKIQRTVLRQRFEAGEFSAALMRADLVSGVNAVPPWFFRKAWRCQRMRRFRAGGDGAVVVFADPSGIGTALSEGLRTAGRTCVMVAVGRDFGRDALDAWRLDPADFSHYRRLLDSLAAEGIEPRTFIHLWTCEPDALPVDGVAALARAQERGVLSVLGLVQALAAGAGPAPARHDLYVIGMGAQCVLAEDAGDFRHAAVVGLLKAFPADLDWLRPHHVDLQPGADASHARYVLEELLDGDEDEVAYRGGKRYGWMLERRNLNDIAVGHSPLRAGGIYLVTGGLGGIGSLVAAELLRDWQVKLVIVGTTALPSRGQWPEALAAGGPVAEKIRRLRDLEALGECRYEQVDVADEVRLREVLSAAELAWGQPLAGVFHLAADDGIGSYWQDAGALHVARATRASFEATFAAKVYGTWVLQRLVAARTGAIMVGFGTVAGLFPSPLAAYAAAQSYLRTTTLAAGRQRRMRSYVYSWSAWRETGLSGGDPHWAPELYRAAGFLMIGRQQGLDSLFGALDRGETDLVIGLDAANAGISRLLRDEAAAREELAVCFTQRDPGVPVARELSRLELADRYGTPGHGRVELLETLPVTAIGRVDTEALRALLAGADATASRAPPLTDTERRIASIWCEVLRLDHLAADTGFFQAGGNSLQAAQVLSRVSREFDVRLEMQDLFAHSTIGALAQRVTERLAGGSSRAGADDLAQLDPESLLARLDELPDEEVAALLGRLQAGEGTS